MTISDHGGWRLLRDEALRRNAAVARGGPEDFPVFESRGKRDPRKHTQRDAAIAGEHETIRRRKRIASGRIKLTDLIHAGLLQPPVTIRGTSRDTQHEAVVGADGRITLADGQTADAPSEAQLLATGKANTGWRYWTLHWRGGDVRLDALRAELLHR